MKSRKDNGHSGTDGVARAQSGIPSEAEKTLVDDAVGFLNLVETSENLIVSVTVGGTLYYANRRWLETLGYSPAEARDLQLARVIRDSERTYIEDVIARVIQTGSMEQASFNFLTREGKLVPVEGSFSCYCEGEDPVAVRGFFRRTSEKPVRDLFSGVPLERIFLEFHDRECSLAEPCFPDED